MNDMNNNLIDNQIVLFKALSDLFSFPNKNNLLKVCDEDLCTINHESYSDLKNDFRELTETLKQTPEQELMVEYARLFVGPYQLVAPPYGSYYLEEGALMGETTVNVMKFYELTGNTLSDSFRDLPDHLIAELDFLYLLLYNEKKLGEDNDKDNLVNIINLKTEFFEKYFKTWILEFTKVVIRESSSEFYRKLAEILNVITSDFQISANSEIHLN